MKRSINEKRAWKRIFIMIPTTIIGLFLFMITIIEEMYLAMTFSLLGIFMAIATLMLSTYQLGWEYKRLDLNSEKDVQK